jgi:hypothetical protein
MTPRHNPPNQTQATNASTETCIRPMLIAIVGHITDGNNYIIVRSLRRHDDREDDKHGSPYPHTRAIKCRIRSFSVYNRDRYSINACPTTERSGDVMVLAALARSAVMERLRARIDECADPAVTDPPRATCTHLSRMIPMLGHPQAMNALVIFCNDNRAWCTGSVSCTPYEAASV